MTNMNINTNAPVIVIMGPQGSGKGTQAMLLRDKLGFQVIEMGKLLRDRAKTDSDLAHTLEQGQLAPDLVKTEIIEEVMADIAPETPLVFDGYPRTPEDAFAFERLMKKHNRTTIKIVHLELDDEIAIERLEQRKTCSSCGRIYKESTEKTCAACGGELIKRTDEHAEATKKRLKWHHEIVAPIIQLYTEKFSAISIDSTKPIEDVYNSIVTFIQDDQNSSRN
jgi:adenylate kinase